MTTITFTPAQFSRYLLELGTGKRFMNACRKGIVGGLQRSRNILVANTRNAPPACANGGVGAVHTGYFLRAWKVTRLPKGAQLSNAAPYSGIIEYGRRPGKRPPQAPLVRWAQLKLGLSKEEAKSAAFLIARAIGKRGLRARKVVERSLPIITKNVFDEMVRALDQELAKAHP